MIIDHNPFKPTYCIKIHESNKLELHFSKRKLLEINCLRYNILDEDRVCALRFVDNLGVLVKKTFLL